MTFYNSLINSEKGMSIKKNRKQLQKLLVSKGLIESTSNINKTLILEAYIKNVLLSAKMK